MTMNGAFDPLARDKFLSSGRPCRHCVQTSRADLPSRPTVQTSVESIDASTSTVERAWAARVRHCWILSAYALGAGEFGTLDPVDLVGRCS
jgi:hypothetical protein